MKVLVVLLLLATSVAARSEVSLPNFDLTDYRVEQLITPDRVLILSGSNQFFCDVQENDSYFEVAKCKPILAADFLVGLAGETDKSTQKVVTEMSELVQLSLADIDRKLINVVRYSGCELGIGLPNSEVHEVIVNIGVTLGLHKSVADQARPEVIKVIWDGFDRLASVGAVEYLNGKARIKLKDCN